MHPPICIHIGLFKTGTTCFRRHLFSQHPQLAFLGPIALSPHRYSNPHYRKVLHNLWSSCPSAKQIEQSRKTWESDIRPSFKADAIALWSEPALCYGSNVYRFRCAQNNKQVFGSCKIVVVLRNIFALAESMYFEDLKQAATDTNRSRRDHVTSFAMIRIATNDPLGFFEPMFR